MYYRKCYIICKLLLINNRLLTSMSVKKRPEPVRKKILMLSIISDGTCHEVIAFVLTTGRNCILGLERRLVKLKTSQFEGKPILLSYIMLYYVVLNYYLLC